ncbi:response regulator transcription factor [Phenylobacterium sp.]|jgi:DNA-binding NarL/FixJ family response regulator|uniref:response regulator transcription factor n=1 Tax=Phenylobacterium sp. TaxID=1871053 RepID=UPI002F93A032
MRGLICDDHPLMREAVAGALRDRWPNLTLDEAGDYPTAWRLAEAGGPAFCLVDLDMPGAAPVDGVAALHACAPQALILALTGLTDAGLLEAVRAAGAAEVFSKNTDATLLIANLAERLPELQGAEAARLPPRQQQVLGLLAEGLTNKEIARRLAISPATVKIHVARLTTWLGAANRTDAAVRAQRARVLRSGG